MNGLHLSSRQGCCRRCISAGREPPEAKTGRLGKAAASCMLPGRSAFIYFLLIFASPCGTGCVPSVKACTCDYFGHKHGRQNSSAWLVLAEIPLCHWLRIANYRPVSTSTMSTWCWMSRTTLGTLLNNCSQKHVTHCSGSQNSPV